MPSWACPERHSVWRAVRTARPGSGGPRALRGREGRGAHTRVLPVGFSSTREPYSCVQSPQCRVPCLDTSVVRLRTAAELGPSSLGLHASCSWEGSSRSLPPDTRPSEDAPPAACHQDREFPSASKAIIPRRRTTVCPRSPGSRDHSARLPLRRRVRHLQASVPQTPGRCPLAR